MKNIFASLPLLATLFTSAAFAESDHFDCSVRRAVDTGCGISNAEVLNTSFDLERRVTVNYNFACGRIVGVSSVHLKSENDQSADMSYASTGTLAVNTMGRVTLEDGNPTRTRKLAFDPGCRLIITSITSQLSDVGLSILNVQADGLVSTADAYLNELGALEGVDVWYKLYVNGGVTKVAVQQVIDMLKAKPDPISRRQVELLQKVIDSGEVLNISGLIDGVKEQLGTIRDQLSAINNRLIAERNTGRKALEEKVQQISDRLI